MTRTSYPSDITDEQWTIIEHLLPKPKPGGRPRNVNLREVVNGIFYLSRTGCAWRLLPGLIFHLGEPSIGIIANGDWMALCQKFTIICGLKCENL